MPTKINNESPIELTANQMEQGSAALGGAAKGAMLGAKLGTIVPGIGNVVGAVAGGLIGGVGGLVKTRKQQQEEELAQQPKYTTNIDPMTGQEIPLTMKKPLKVLTQTGSDSPVPYNMSAAQYKSGVLMKNISGAATLMTADEKKAKIDAIPGMPEEVKNNMKAAVKKKGELKTYEVVAKDNPKGTGTKTDYTVYGGLEGEEKNKLYRKTKTQSF
tara:strand:+ start:1420 stop:2064 length:645 start_codon:yes stop_codon:yes gene_type:complete